MVVELAIMEGAGLDVMDRDVGLLGWTVVVACDPRFGVDTIDD